MSQRSILRALRTAIQGIGLDIPIIYPNVKPTAPSGAARAEVSFIFNPPEPFIDGMDQQSGICQILLLYPLGEGDGAIMDTSDLIRKAFRSGSRKKHGDQTVSVIRCGAGTSTPLDGMYACPVSIYWEALTEREC